MSPSTLPYQPLGINQIRLVRLLRESTHNSTQLVSLQIVSPISLENPPPYHALSYVWGDANITRPVKINDIPWNITTSLFDFLQSHQRNLGSKLDLLWIDAICIDQCNNGEKNVQLPLMRQIYQSSTSTISWVGKENTEFDKGWELIDKVPKAGVFDGKFHGHIDGVLDRWIRDEKNKELVMVCWPSFNSLISIPYFSRVWIKQEYIVSTTIEICYGNRTANLLDFQTVGSNLAQTDAFINIFTDLEAQKRWKPEQGADLIRNTSAIRALEAARFLRDKRHLGFPLLRLLCDYRDADATNPRDKVYGIMGLLPALKTPEALGYDPNLLIVNYNTPLGVVYGSVVRAVVAATGNLNILSAACQAGEIFEIPSWAPDWSKYWRKSRPLLQEQMLHGRLPQSSYSFQASGAAIPKLHFSKDLTTLYVQGIIIDEITEIWPPLPLYEGDGAEDMRRFTNYRKRAFEWCYDKRSPRYLDSRHSLDALWETLTVLQQGQNDSLPSDRVGLRGDFEDWVRNGRIGRDMVYRTQLTMIEKRTMSGEKGFLICGPEVAVVGDFVVVLLGCDVPVVLRRREGHYVLIGECYCQGAMRGEALETLDSRENPIVEFELH